MPPQHGKSTFISHALPTWFLSEYPDRRVLLTSYEAEFAASWGGKVRQSLKEHKAVFGKSLSKDTDKMFAIAGRRGYMQSVGVGGAVTGKGADLFIIDDPVKNAEQAMSSTYRQKVWDWYLSTVLTRLSEDGILILVMTRWHADDLAGRLIAAMRNGDGETFHVVNLPALADEGDILGRTEGEPLAPELYSRERLQIIKRAVGPYWWSAIYQQRPTTAETQIVKRSQWRRYNKDVPPKFVFILQSWDTALKKGQQNDYSCCTTWGVASDGMYLLDVLYDKLLYPDLREAVKAKANIFAPNVVIVEDKGSGTSVTQELQIDSRLPILAWPVEDGDKVLRLNLVASAWESGRVFIPEGSEYDELIEEMANFPNVPHDDRTDSVSQAMSFYLKRLASRNPDEQAAVDRIVEGSGRSRRRREATSGFM